MNDRVSDIATREVAWNGRSGLSVASLLGRLRTSLVWKLLLSAGLTFLVMTSWELVNADEPVTPAYVMEEVVDTALLIGFGTMLALLLLRRLSRHATDIDDLRGDIEAAKAQGGAWRDRMRDQMADLASAVQQQFRDWGLSDAEQDIGFLLLKGLSLKEIATIRATHEGTVRQQAGGIYRKSGLEGRTALAAFFFEDMLAPPIRTIGGNGAHGAR